MRKVVLPLLMSLVGCMPGNMSDTASRGFVQDTVAPTGLPPLKVFTSTQPTRPTRSNRDIARDFLELSFNLESGRELPALTRFEHPISVRLTGAPPASLLPDLTRLIYRMKTEAGLNVSLTRASDANITVQAVSRAEIRKSLPSAACFVVPNISDISEYKAARRTAKTNWALLRNREKLAIFVPNDASPQEVRDCLHEELAQAIGPLNDLYRLPDSVFNDDNIHTVLTGFDMLILRAYYAPELRTGMSKRQVAAVLPTVLARLNPAGENISPQRTAPTPRSYITAVQTALGPGSSMPQRRKAAQKALDISRAFGWQDHRRAFAHYAMGRIASQTNSAEALKQFQAADQFYARTPNTGLHRAYIASQLASHALSQGNGVRALSLVNPAIHVARRHENAALLSTLMLLRAEALELTGRSSEARHVRLDSLGWARYGFGSDWAVRAKMREIAALSPTRG
ncbi:DUF2927 domain-containing protein [Lentibacter algarum]|uniref:DUF2927 domain-containing protein n=1 Tax=Lentibacter algarum TaxID=576131 RepID=UPI001C07DE3F|nr:DUF2927 domain-containing protein [Lentibacter algarum]MBU2980827.1 DUF2927 domain-containing protein [Lentibacter algarum]